MIQIRQNCSIEMGNGCKVRFWEDVWCGEAPLCSSFPSLYEVASSKGDKVADLWEVTGTGGGWIAIKKAITLYGYVSINGVFLKVNKATMNMLHRVEQAYVTYMGMYLSISLLFFLKSYPIKSFELAKIIPF